MSAITREEFNARIETIEVRMDGRLARIEDAFSRIFEDNKDIRTGISSLKTTVITSAIGAVLAIVLGVAAFNATVLSNMVASFESGKNTTAAQAEVRRQTEETAAILRKIQADIAKPSK